MPRVCHKAQHFKHTHGRTAQKENLLLQSDNETISYLQVI
jgi:hypothetical protein